MLVYQRVFQVKKRIRGCSICRSLADHDAMAIIWGRGDLHGWITRGKALMAKQKPRMIMLGKHHFGPFWHILVQVFKPLPISLQRLSNFNPFGIPHSTAMLPCCHAAKVDTLPCSWRDRNGSPRCQSLPEKNDPGIQDGAKLTKKHCEIG